MTGWRKRTIMEMAREADPKANLSEPYCLDPETRAWRERFAALVREEALAQPEQEPMHPELRKMWEDYFDKCFRAMPLPEYTTPPQPTWVNLPDEEIKILWIQYRAALPRYLCFAKALLARAKEKNT